MSNAPPQAKGPPIGIIVGVVVFIITVILLVVVFIKVRSPSPAPTPITPTGTQPTVTTGTPAPYTPAPMGAQPTVTGAPVPTGAQPTMTFQQRLAANNAALQQSLAALQARAPPRPTIASAPAPITPTGAQPTVTTGPLASPAPAAPFRPAPMPVPVLVASPPPTPAPIVTPVPDVIGLKTIAGEVGTIINTYPYPQLYAGARGPVNTAIRVRGTSLTLTVRNNNSRNLDVYVQFRSPFTGTVILETTGGTQLASQVVNNATSVKFEKATP